MPRIAAINLECVNPYVLGRVWADMPGSEVALETSGFCAVKVGGNYLGAAHVDN